MRLLYTQISLLYHVKVLSQYMLDKCTKNAFNYSRCLYDKCIVACSHRTQLLANFVHKYLNLKVSYVTYIKQKGECIIKYCGRPCDEVAERVWPIKISDGARTTLFNKGLVSCDVNQSQRHQSDLPRKRPPSWREIFIICTSLARSMRKRF